MLLSWLPNALIYPFTSVYASDHDSDCVWVHVDFNGWYQVAVAITSFVTLMGACPFFLCGLCIHCRDNAYYLRNPSTEFSAKEADDAEQGSMVFLNSLFCFLSVMVCFGNLLAIILLVKKGFSGVLAFELTFDFNFDAQYNIVVWSGMTRILLFVMLVIELAFYLASVVGFLRCVRHEENVSGAAGPEEHFEGAANHANPGTGANVVGVTVEPEQMTISL
jgi:hypothetical protein